VHEAFFGLSFVRNESASLVAEQQFRETVIRTSIGGTQQPQDAAAHLLPLY